MYKSYTEEELRKGFELPIDYSVDGVVSCGAWGHKKWIDIFENNLNKTKIQFTKRQLPEFLDHIYEYTINENIYWFSITYGPVRLSEYLHLACLLGSKNNIHIGSCGGLTLKLDACDIIIPTYSWDPGTAVSIYLRNTSNKAYPDLELSTKAYDELKSSKKKVYKGPIVTCQGMLGETQDDILKWSEQGYLGVEMETATVFAVSNHFKVPSTAIIYITDNLIKEETVLSKQYEGQKEERQLAKEEVTRIAQKLILET